MQGDTKPECVECMGNINATMDLLSRIGFSIHTGKLFLMRKREFLGFLTDSKNMKISLSNKKAEHLHLNPISIGGGGDGGGYNVSQGYIFVKNF